jgi:CheY-like chemotaxis protein
VSSDSLELELIKAIPSILWFLLVLAALLIFYKPIRNDLIPHLTGLSALGVELSFVKDSINAAIEMAEKSPQWKVEISPEDKERALRRAHQHLNLLGEAQILWVDDHPENNVNERRMLRQLKAGLDTAKTTEEALEMLRRGNYDLVLSDMSRGADPAAGLKLAEQLQKEKPVPLIIYIGDIDPAKGVPPYTFGITNRPDELLHLTLDALERKKPHD